MQPVRRRRYSTYTRIRQSNTASCLWEVMEEGRAEGRMRTDRTPLCVLLPDALDRMQLHLDDLAGAQLRKDYIRVRRGGRPRSKHRRLLALRLPDEVAALDVLVDIWGRGALFCALARYVEPAYASTRM